MKIENKLLNFFIKSVSVYHQSSNSKKGLSSVKLNIKAQVSGYIIVIDSRIESLSFQTANELKYIPKDILN